MMRRSPPSQKGLTNSDIDSSSLNQTVSENEQENDEEDGEPMPPVTPEELDNALFYMPDDKTLYMVHLSQDMSNAENMYIDYDKGSKFG